MPRIGANLSFLFDDVPFLDRFARAAAAGFAGVEFHFPYDTPPEAVRAALEGHRLTPILFNLPPGELSAGELGFACHPGRAAAFREGVAQARDYARAIGCRQINCLAGKRPMDVPIEDCRRALVENLAYAAAALGKNEIKLMIEPINDRDVPGFFLTRCVEAAALIAEVGSDNLFLQFDIYHVGVMEGDVAPHLARHLQQIGHIQFADHPGRHEPGSGALQVAKLLGDLDRWGYRGWASAEYRPRGATEESLAWFGPWRGHATAQPG